MVYVQYCYFVYTYNISVYIYIYMCVCIPVTLHFEATYRILYVASITVVICCILTRFKLSVWTL
jgi:hypothetical protein